MSSDRATLPWESAVVVRVAALDQIVRSLRERFDLPRKPHGIPPHVTAIVPFLPWAELSGCEGLAALRAVCEATAPFDVTFARTARFPRVLYLAPEPADPFIALTRTLMARWPRLQPYGGEHSQIVPHLTVTTSRPPEVFDQIDTALAEELPIRTRIDAAQLYRFDGRAWSEQASLAFHGSGSGDRDR